MSDAIAMPMSALAQALQDAVDELYVKAGYTRKFTPEPPRRAKGGR